MQSPAPRLAGDRAVLSASVLPALSAVVYRKRAQCRVVHRKAWSYVYDRVGRHLDRVGVLTGGQIAVKELEAECLRLKRDNKCRERVSRTDIYRGPAFKAPGDLKVECDGNADGQAYDAREVQQHSGLLHLPGIDRYVYDVDRV